MYLSANERLFSGVNRREDGPTHTGNRRWRGRWVYAYPSYPFSASYEEREPVEEDD